MTGSYGCASAIPNNYHGDVTKVIDQNGKVLTSPDTQNDLRLISIDIQKKDYLAAGLDTIGLLVPAGTGFGELSKPVQEGVVWLSKKLGKSVDEVLKMAGKGAGDTSKYVNIASKGKTKHILFGDATGGGHIWPGSPNKTPFPKGWSGDKIMHEVSDIATDPSLKWIENRVVKGVQRYEVVGVRGGVKIKVITDGKNIITAFPVK